MRQDVITAAQLQIFAEVALLLFVLAFIMIAVRAFMMSKAEEGQLERMPMDDGTVAAWKENSHE